MLVSREEQELFNQPYKFIRALLNTSRQPTLNAPSAKSGVFQMSLKFYVLFVNDCNTHPIVETGSAPRITDKSEGDSHHGSSGDNSGIGADSNIGGEFITHYGAQHCELILSIELFYLSRCFC